MSIFVRSLLMFYYSLTLVWVPSSDRSVSGYKKPDGTYTGLSGLLHSNQSDISIFPLPLMLSDGDDYDVGPAVYYSSVVLTSTPEILPKSQNILKQMFDWPIEIYVLLLASIWFLSYFLSKLDTFSNRVEGGIREENNKLSFGSSLWYIVEYGMQQDTYEPKTWSGKRLTLSAVVGLFFWYSIWTNIFTSDMITFDTNAFRSLRDVIERNATVYIFTADPAYYLLEREAETNPKSELSQVLGMVVKVDNAKQPSKAGKMLMEKKGKKKDPRGEGTLMLEMIVNQFKSLYCSLNMLLMISEDKYLPANFGPYFRKGMDQNIRDMLTKRFVIMGEAGTLFKMFGDFDRVMDTIAGPQDWFKWIIEDLDHWLQTEMESGDVKSFSLEKFYGTFSLFFACLMIAALALLYEKVVNARQQHARRRLIERANQVKRRRNAVYSISYMIDITKTS